MNTSASERASSRTDDVVELVLPRGHRYIATARVVAASVGADLGLDVDQIDDLRLAVDEAVAVVVEAADPSGHDRVGIRFANDAGSLTVRVGAVGEAATPTITRDDIDPLALRIIEAVADEFEVADGALIIHKRTSAGDAVA